MANSMLVADASDTAAACQAGRSSLGGVATVGFLGAAAGLQMSDRGVADLLSPAIKATFTLDDATIGALHGVAGILVASALAVPLAQLADRHSRKRILVALIAAWAAMTMTGALAPTFALFFVGRAASGVTEFAMIPIVYSLIPDLVGERWRVAGNLSFAALMAIGASAGFYLGGHLLAAVTPLAHCLHLDPWRMAMLTLGLTGVPACLSAMLTVDPPRRSLMAEPGIDHHPASGLLTLVRSRWRPIVLFIGAAGGLAVAVQATLPMAAMALQRRYAIEVSVVGRALGTATLVTSLASLFVAGLTDRLLAVRLGPLTRPIIMGAATAVALPCAWLLAGAADERAAVLMLTGFLFATCVANALIPTMLQDIVPAELRARAFAAYSFLIAAFCAAGPVLSGGLSDHVATGDLLLAISMVAVPALALSAACSAMAVWSERSVGK